eukprot:CAMPEP_0113968970 /NCGR_PEP_ID=MMETSP0011_2-20120614/9914_1 /TAXON_ID=101924 /ORGANISM="Rhodosorus marinus" /LENGTH=72 /DNA_ID=CAMNT_0000982289 /DNA_START=257 /DNA_END=475 /DNA_ORIENTATION=+ /assembly_acc=CAM_ASM_000156
MAFCIRGSWSMVEARTSPRVSPEVRDIISGAPIKKSSGLPEYPYVYACPLPISQLSKARKTPLSSMPPGNSD